MAIDWLENTAPRWSGKIRAGTRDEKTKKLHNTPHFLLHDAPQLIPVLGENPTEIYFTVHSNIREEYFPTDLRWYNANELVCKSMHRYINPENGQDMGLVAAFFKNNVEVPGLTQTPFPGIKRARVRRCSKACPDLNSGNCSEHFFLHMVIPHFSMGEMFTLDNTSWKGMNNLSSTFKLQNFRHGGALSGEIFRMFKRKEEGHYMKDSGDRGKTEVNVVAIEHVEFEDYLAKFQDKIKPIDLECLLSVREAKKGMARPALLPPDDPALLGDAPMTTAALPESPAAVEQSNEDAVRARANDPSVAKYFAEIATLLGKENSEELRMKTAERYSLPDLVQYLQGRIKDVKKTKQGVAKPTAAAKVTTHTSATPPPAVPKDDTGEQPRF